MKSRINIILNYSKYKLRMVDYLDWEVACLYISDLLIGICILIFGGHSEMRNRLIWKPWFVLSIVQKRTRCLCIVCKKVIMFLNLSYDRGGGGGFMGPRFLFIFLLKISPPDQTPRPTCIFLILVIYYHEKKIWKCPPHFYLWKQ